MIDHQTLIRKAHPVQDRLAVSGDTPFIILCLIGSYHIVIDRDARRKDRLLGQIPDIDLTASDNRPRIRLFQARKDPKQCGLPGPVDPHDPDLVPLFHSQVNPGKKCLLCIAFLYLFCCQ